MSGWVATLLGLWLLLPPQLGGHLGVTVVYGDSMSPTYATGDLLFTWRTERYSVDDVLVFTIREGEVGAGLGVVHRVVETLPGGAYRLLGDDNEFPDPWTPTADEVQGRVVARVPGGSWLLTWLFSPIALAGLTGVLTALAIVRPARPRAADDGDDGDGKDGKDDGGGRDGGDPGKHGPWGIGVPRRLARTRLRRSNRAHARRAAAAAGLLLLCPAWMSTASSAATLGDLRDTDLFAMAEPTSVPGLAHSQQLVSDDPLEYCADVTVTNEGDATVDWQITVDLSQEPFDATSITSSSGVTSVDFAPPTWTVEGAAGNRTLAAGASTTWSYCGSRADDAPTADASTTVVVTSSTSSSYCATVTVQTGSATWVRWRSTIDHTTPGVTDPVYWLDTQPTDVTGATSTSFEASSGTWTTQGAVGNAHVKAGRSATWDYCAPLSDGVPLVTASASAQVTSEQGGSYCAQVTVSTAATSPIRWRAVIDPSTPGLNKRKYDLAAQPTDVTGAVSVSFDAGTNTWTVRGSSGNGFVKSGGPTTFTYCSN